MKHDTFVCRRNRVLLTICVSVCAELGMSRVGEWRRPKPLHSPCLLIAGQSPLAVMKQQVNFKALLTC